MITLAGVLALSKCDTSELPPEQRYIHEVSSQNGIDLVITMLPSLAHCIHTAQASLHDNTYKRTYGVWKEWEVVVWHQRLNTRTFTKF
jgi:hypothetical protein